MVHGLRVSSTHQRNVLQGAEAAGRDREGCNDRQGGYQVYCVPYCLLPLFRRENRQSIEHLGLTARTRGSIWAVHVEGHFGDF